MTLEPKSAAAYNLLGMAYRFKYNQLANPDLKQKEIEAFQKAVDIDSKYWMAMINLGASYYYQGEKAKAAAWFKQALALNPDNPERAELEKMIAAGKAGSEVAGGPDRLVGLTLTWCGSAAPAGRSRPRTWPGAWAVSSATARARAIKLRPWTGSARV